MKGLDDSEEQIWREKCLVEVHTGMGEAGVEGGHISQRIKGTEGKSEGHEKKHHASESPHPRIRHTEVSGVRKLYHGLHQHQVTHVDRHSDTL